MERIIKIKKGLDLPIEGAAEKRVVDLRSEELFAVKPPDVVGFTPRLQVAEGDSVQAGQVLVRDKRDPRLTLTSPVNGTVEAVVRGEKRAMLEVVVRQSHTASMATEKPQSLTPESPCWWMLRERPFGTIADPDHKPKGIFISMIDTAPLATDIDFALQGRGHEVEAGLSALATLAPVHVCIGTHQQVAYHIPNCTVHRVQGPHPAGNVGTQIAAISPISKGECMWTVGAQDVANIGRWMLTGCYRPERVIAVAGPAARTPHYYRVLAGTNIGKIAQAQLMNRAYPALAKDNSGTRVISGNVLSGTTLLPDGFLSAYDSMLTLLPEGDYYDFMGWLMPGLNKHSFSSTFLSGMLRPMAKLLPVQPSYKFDTNVHGSVRPFLFTGNFERVFPFDIYPLQLIKACIVGDIELQEQLGIYEVEPEDLALCEYIDPSKTDIQRIIREALETLRKEATA